MFAEIAEQHLHTAAIFNPLKPHFRRSLRVLPAAASRFEIDFWLLLEQPALVEIAERELAGRWEQAAAQLYGSTGIGGLGDYFDLLRLWKQTIAQQTAKADRRIEALTKAIGKFESTVQRLKDIATKMQEDLPLKDKLAAEAEDCFQRLQKVQENATHFKGLLDADEKLLEEESQKVAEEKAELDKMTAEVMAPLNNILELIGSLTRNDLSEMKQLYSGQNVPADLRTALDCVAIIFQEKEDSDSVKKMINEAAFLGRFKQFDILGRRTQQAFHLKNKLAQSPNFRPAEMKGSNLAAKLFCEWAWIVNNFPDSHKPVEHKKALFSESTSALAQVENTTMVKRDRMDQFNRDIKELENKYRSLIEQKDQTEAGIARAQGQLANGERLIQETNSLCQRWREELDRHHRRNDTLQEEVFFGCCAMVLTAKFQHRQCLESIKKWRALGVFEQDHPNWVGTFAEDRLTHALLVSGLPVDEHLLEKLCFIERSTHPLVIVDRYCVAEKVLQQLEPAVFVESSRFLEEMAELSKLEKATCFIRLGQASDLSRADIEHLLEWDFSDPTRRPEQVRALCSPSFRWHFLLSDSSLDSAASSLRTVDFTPSEATLASIITSRLSSNEAALKARAERNTAELQRLRDGRFLSENQQFITEAFETTASELFDDEPLVARVQKLSASIGAALESLKASLPAAGEQSPRASQRVLEVFGVLSRVRSLSRLYHRLSFSRYLDICQAHLATTEAEEEDYEPKVRSLCNHIANRVLTEEHRLLFLFLVAADVALRKGLVSPAEYEIFKESNPDLR